MRIFAHNTSNSRLVQLPEIEHHDANGQAASLMLQGAWIERVAPGWSDRLAITSDPVSVELNAQIIDSYVRKLLEMLMFGAGAARSLRSQPFDTSNSVHKWEAPFEQIYSRIPTSSECFFGVGSLLVLTPLRRFRRTAQRSTASGGRTNLHLAETDARRSLVAACPIQPEFRSIWRPTTFPEFVLTG
jgi:hypothetical protein